jgi:hypothetical protein
LSQGSQDLLNFLQMFLLDVSKVEDVNQIYDHKGFCEWIQYIIHHLHECVQIISQEKIHDQPLEETLFRIECCLPYISLLNEYMVVS